MKWKLFKLVLRLILPTLALIVRKNTGKMFMPKMKLLKKKSVPTFLMLPNGFKYN